MVTVFGKVLGPDSIPVNSLVRFELRNYGSKPPRLLGSNVIVDKIHTEVIPDNTGTFSVRLIDNAQIDPPKTYYHVSFYQKGQLASQGDWLINGPSVFNLNTEVELSTEPIVTTPTGDTTYLRVDSGNIVGWKGDIGIQVFNVRAFNAVGDGVADDTAAIQAAINAAQLVGARVEFPRGSYLISSPLIISARVILDGSGTDVLAWATLITNNNMDLIRVNDGASGSRICRLSFSKLGAIGTAGAAVRVNLPTWNPWGTPIHLSELMVNNVYDGIVFENGNVLTVRDCVLAVTGHDGFKMTGGLDARLFNCQFYGCINSGIEMTGGAALNLEAVECYHGIHCFIISGEPYQVFSRGCFFDSPSGDAILVNNTAGGNFIYFDGCWCGGSTTGCGLHINQDTGGGLTWRGGNIRANHLSGVFYEGSGSNYNFVAIDISANGRGHVAGNKYGIRVKAGKSNFRISDCMVGSVPGDPTDSQDYGIFVEAGSSDHYIIVNNLDVGGNLSGLLSDGGTGTHKTVTGNV